MNVVLTGFMGAGKSTIGRRLARILELSFIDTDAEIVNKHGRISDIFEREGEARFRAYERTELERLGERGPAVIAVGGGAVVDPKNRTLLRRGGVIVHLAISAEAAHARIARRAHRPLLGVAPSVEAVRALLARRAAAYADNDLAIDVERRTPSSVAHSIARWYRERMTRAATVR
jgi:shikimate kinase